MVSKTIGTKVSLEEYATFKRLIEEDNQHAKEVGEHGDLTMAKAIREFVRWNVKNGHYMSMEDFDQLCGGMDQPF